MHTILIPYDFSPSSENAANYALSLFANRSTRFIFAHVSNDPDLDEDTIGSELQEAIDTLSKLAVHPHHKFEHFVKSGDVVQGIVQASKEFNVDAIFMGAKGKNDIRTRIMGNTTSGVIEKALVPVMAIPLQSKYAGYRKMVLGTDYRPVKDFDSYEYLMKLLSLSNAEFIVLNVENDDKPVTMEQTMSGITMERSMPKRPHRYDFVHDKSPVRGILKYVKENQIDLLAMLKRDHYLMNTTVDDSVVTQTVQGIETPLLSLPDVIQ